MDFFLLPEILTLTSQQCLKFQITRVTMSIQSGNYIYIYITNNVDFSIKLLTLYGLDERISSI